MKNIFRIIQLLFLAVAIQLNVAGQAQDNWTKKKAETWFAGGSWKNGLKLNAHKSTDKVEFARQYHKNKALWDKAFAYLRDTNLDSLALGKHPIVGDDVFASVTETPTKDFKDTRFESHKKYIDIQYVIRGKEKMGVLPLAKAKNTVPYDPKKEVAFYESSEGDYYEAVPGTFFIFFPSDAHRPSIKVDGVDSDKKIVIKIRVAE